MNAQVWMVIVIPFLGTCLGAAMVLFLKDRLSKSTERMLSGFAAGVMVAASIWSLLLPAMDGAADMGRLSFIPAAVGFLIGIGFLLLLDNVTPHIHKTDQHEGPRSRLKRTTKLILAGTLHNIPEGMAVGVVYAGWASGNTGITVMGALSLALGIAIQNFPEGAIISMPLHSNGLSKKKSCWYGILSGIVEPVAGLITVLLAHYIVPVLPYLLGFAAGAMIYVVVEELIPEMSEGEHNNITTIIFMLGFSLMLALDVAMG